MPDLLQQLSLPAGWEVWGVTGAGVAVAFLAFFAGRRFFSGPSASVVERSAAGAESPATAPPPDPFEVGSRFEKRAAARRKGSQVEVQILPESEAGPRLTGWVVDRSLSGLGISTEHKVVRGTILKVRPRNAPAEAPWVEIEVRRCQVGEDGAWQLGCSFRKTPPYNVLLLFG